VAQWSDKSGAGLHFTQATAVSQPAYVVAAHNGLATIRFDGSNDSLALSTNTLLRNAPALTAFAVAKSAEKKYQYIFWIEASSPTNISRFRFDRNNSNRNSGASWAPNDTTVSRLSGPVGEWPAGDLAVVSTRIDLAGGNASLRFNGSQADDMTFAGGGSFANSDSNSARVGRSRADNATLWPSDICEIILYHRALTPTEMGQVEAYLLEKWGVA